MSTYGEVGSDVHGPIKKLAIRRVQHRSETHSNESQHLAEGTEVARLRRRFSFVLQQALSFRTRHHLCRQGVALASTRQLRSQGPVSVQAHHTEGVINRVRGTERSERGRDWSRGRERRWERRRGWEWGRERSWGRSGNGNGGEGERRSAGWKRGRGGDGDGGRDP